MGSPNTASYFDHEREPSCASLLTVLKLTMANYQADTLLQHLISRVHQDVQILVDLGHIDRHTAESFLVSLPNGQQTAHPVQSAVTFPIATPSVIPAVKKTFPTPAPKPVRTQARALWAYNEKGTVGIVLGQAMFFA